MNAEPGRYRVSIRPRGSRAYYVCDERAESPGRAAAQVLERYTLRDDTAYEVIVRDIDKERERWAN